MKCGSPKETKVSATAAVALTIAAFLYQYWYIILIIFVLWLLFKYFFWNVILPEWFIEYNKNKVLIDSWSLCQLELFLLKEGVLMFDERIIRSIPHASEICAYLKSMCRNNSEMENKLITVPTISFISDVMMSDRRQSLDNAVKFVLRRREF